MRRRQKASYATSVKFLGLILLVTAGFPFAATAGGFEIKGLTTGVEFPKDMIKDCKGVANADSGIPGYLCSTTVGGEQARLDIAVHEERVVALIFTVKNGLMRPVMQALSEKYGRPGQHNRYIEDYSWSQGRENMSIKENRLDRGYDLILIDFALFERAQAAQKNKVKKDL